MLANIKTTPSRTWVLLLIFTISGLTHLINPSLFVALVPPVLGPTTFWIYLSGIAELLCALGLFLKQKWPPKLTALVLLIIWVGNWWYAIDVTRSSEANLTLILGAWLRLPLQIPLIKWALKSPVKLI